MRTAAFAGLLWLALSAPAAAGTVPVIFSKSFVDDPAPPGGDVVVRYRLQNTDRELPLTEVQFIDDHAATLSALATTAPLPIAPCGAGSVLSGGGTLQLLNGTVPADGVCEFEVLLRLPAGAAPGAYLGPTSSLSGNRSGIPISAPPAVDTLDVEVFPELSIVGPSLPFASGSNFSLQFTLRNSSLTETASSIRFVLDERLLFQPGDGGVSGGFPSAPCGGASSLSNQADQPGPGRFGLVLEGGELPAGASCTFSVEYAATDTAPAGPYVAATTPVTAIVGGGSVAGRGASLRFDVVRPPTLSHEFLPASGLPGSAPLIRYRLSNPADNLFEGVDLGFSHDLDAVLPGLAATSLPSVGECGVDASLVGTAFLTFSGGALGPGQSCSFDVSVQVPPTAESGTYASSTSILNANFGGGSVPGSPAEASYVVTDLALRLEVLDDPTLAGGTVSLAVELENLDSEAYSDLAFTLDLGAALGGLQAQGLPVSAVCGAGAQLSGSSVLSFSGGQLAAGQRCDFTVTLVLPPAAPAGAVSLAVPEVTGVSGGVPVTLPGASATLEVVNLLFSRRFLSAAVPGGTVELEYEIRNPAAAGSVAGPIAFSDDLDGLLSGLSASGAPMADICGEGSSLTGSAQVNFDGGALAPGATCRFSLTLTVPDGVAGSFDGSSGPLLLAGFANAPGAVATLQVLPLQASVLVTPVQALPGGAVQLQVELRNLGTAPLETVVLEFDLASAIPGAEVLGLPVPGPCGPDSELSGTGVARLLIDLMDALQVCSFTLSVQLPASVQTGSYEVSSGVPSSRGQAAGLSASGRIDVVQPVLSKSFSPAFAQVQTTSRLTLVFDNSTTALSLAGLEVVDPLPSGLVIATPPNLSNTCGGDALAVAGGGILSLADGSLAAGAQCQVQVDVLAMQVGALLNTTDVARADQGTIGSASASLTAFAGPAFEMAFSPQTVLVGGSSTLSFTVINTAGPGAVGGLAFTNTLPAGLAVAPTPQASSTCGGLWSPSAGSNSLSFSAGLVAANTSCVVRVDVRGGAAGSFENLSSPLTTNGLPSPAASATLRIEGPPGFSKSFQPAAIAVDQSSRLILRIDNSTGSIDIGALAFTDVFPAGLSLAPSPNASTSCTGGVLVANAGTGSLSYSGGTVPAGSICTVEADVVAAASGSYTNVSGALSSAAGDSGSATAQLQVADAVLQIEKSFDPELAFAGDWVLVRYRLVNPSLAATVTEISFTDDVGVDVPGAETLPLPGPDVCGAGSGVAGLTSVSLVSGQLGPGAECVFGVQFRLPPNIATGSYESITSAVNGRVGTGVAVGAPASATLTVAALPSLVKTMPATARQGELIELVFTLTHPAGSPAVSGLRFSDDLEAFLPGARAEGLPLSDVCGPGSSISGSSLLSFQAGSLGSGQSCSFSVPVRLPATALPGNYTNVTSPLQGSFGAVPANGGLASAASRGLSLGSALPAPTVVSTADSRTYALLALLLACIGAVALRRRS